MDRHAADMNRGEASNVVGSEDTQGSVQMTTLAWFVPSTTGGPCPMEILVPWLEDKYPRFVDAGRHERATMISMLCVQMQRAGHNKCRDHKITSMISLLRREARLAAHPNSRERQKRPSYAFKRYKNTLMKVFGFSRTPPDDEADPHVNDEMQARRQHDERPGFTAENPIVIDGDDEHPHDSTVGVAAHAAGVTKEECPPLKQPRVPTNAARSEAGEDVSCVIFSALADTQEMLGDTSGTRENESIYRFSRSELAIEQFINNLASSYAVADRVRFTQLLATNVSAAMLYCRLDAASQRHFVDEVLAGKTVFNK